MGTIFVDNLEPQSGTSLTLGASGDTLQAASGVTNNLGISEVDQWKLTASAGVLAGSYLIEKTFGIDGIGLLGFNALIERDYDIMMGTLAFGTIIGQIGNLISDIAYAIVDPRIRFK